MKKIIYICCLILIALPRSEGQNLQVSGSKIELPTGIVLGAAFYEEKGMFFVQQAANHQRQLSSWDLTSHAIITKRITDKAVGSYFCGRVQVSINIQRVYVCSSESSHLEILDPHTLEPSGTIAHINGQTIMDFAVDDPNSRVFVLSARRDKSVRLTSYSLLTGDEQQETTLLDISHEAPYAPDLVSVSKSGEIGVYLLDRSGSLVKNNSGIYMCKDAPSLACAHASDADETSRISEISFLGQDILAVSSKSADDGERCVISVSPGYRYSIAKPLSFGSSHKYCTHLLSGTGVHYAVGVIEDKYVAGFTGMSSYNAFAANLKIISNSFSVWRAGSSKVVTILKIPTDSGIPNAFRIVASNTKPLFIAYCGMSNTLYLYSIADH